MDTKELYVVEDIESYEYHFVLQMGVEPTDNHYVLDIAALPICVPEQVIFYGDQTKNTRK